MNYLITGCGSVGGIAIKSILRNKLCDRLIAVDKDERTVHKCKTELDGLPISMVLADLSNQSDIDKIVDESIDTIIHTAAVKHVHLCEQNPIMAAINNIHATDMLVRAAIKKKVRRFIYINTDKSIMPTSVMGATKMIAEKLLLGVRHKIKVNIIRLGNVINSNGSLIPTIVDLVIKNLPVKVTDPDATRYFLAPSELANFLNFVMSNDISDSILIKQMRACRLGDMVDATLEFLNAKDHGRDIIGLRDGEKLHEHLYTESEAPYILNKKHYITIGDIAQNDNRDIPCSSDDCIDKDGFLKILQDELYSSNIYYSKFCGMLL